MIHTLHHHEMQYNDIVSDIACGENHFNSPTIICKQNISHHHEAAYIALTLVWKTIARLKSYHMFVLVHDHCFAIMCPFSDVEF